MNQWEILKELVKKLTAPMAFAAVIIIVLAIFGGDIPPVYQALIYIVVIAVLLYIAIPIVGSAIQQFRGQKKPDESTDDEPKKEHDETPKQDNPPRKPHTPAINIYLESVIQDCCRFRNVGLDPTASDPARGGLPLEKLYRSLDTTTMVEEGSGKPSTTGDSFPRNSRPLSALEALQTCPDNHMVLLGLPGTGKTTFIRYLALCMAQSLVPNGTHLTETLPEWKQPSLLPVIVPLARFADYIPAGVKKGNADLVADFILQFLKDDNRTTGSEDQIWTEIQNRDCLFFFDGLDEVTNISLRPIIVDSIEAFSRRHHNARPDNRFLVTCRYYSYYYDPAWQLTGWTTHVLALFTPPKIHEFINAWYEEHTRLEPGKKADYDRKRDNLHRRVEPGDRRGLAEIAPFPIILTMMAIVNTHYGDLPEKKAQVYERCIDLLLVRWEQEREIAPGQTGKRTLTDALGMDRAKLDRAIWQVAYKTHEGWIEQNQRKPDQEKGETLLTEDLLSAVLSVHFQDPAKVKIFLDYCRESNGLIMEQGTQRVAGAPPESEPRRIYGFPHRSFQEYLAGRFLVGANLGRRVRELMDKSDLWRDVVLLLGEYLCFQASDEERVVSMLHALSPERLNSPADAATWRAAWLAGELLILHRSVFAPSKQDEIILHNLRQLVEREALSLPERAAAADVLDELGWYPEDLDSFVPIPDSANPAFFIGKYPVTNLQYKRFLDSGDYREKDLWVDFPHFDQNEGNAPPSGLKAWEWLQAILANPEDESVQDGKLLPRYWKDPRFGIGRPTAPVVGISWWEANAYCRWLKNHWNDPAVHNQRAAPFAIQQVRLPLESQWVQAAGGMKPEDRYPWEEGGIRNRADLSARANTIESRLNKTTPVWMYPRGESTRGVRDMAGNVWEWQANYYDKSKSSLVFRGGSWDDNNGNARVAARSGYRPSSRYANLGFRVCVLPA